MSPGWGGNSQRRGSRPVSVAVGGGAGWVESFQIPALPAGPPRPRQVRQPQPCGCDRRCVQGGRARPPALPLSVAFHQLRTLHPRVSGSSSPFFAGGTGEGTTEQSDILPSSLDGRSGSKGGRGGRAGVRSGRDSDPASPPPLSSPTGEGHLISTLNPLLTPPA